MSEFTEIYTDSKMYWLEALLSHLGIATLLLPVHLAAIDLLY